MANGSQSGLVTEYLHQIPLQIGEHTETVSLDITGITKYDVVLGMAWLHQHNPKIDWKNRTLEFMQCSTGKGDQSPPKVPMAKAI